jgi:hypothetical protein
MWRYWLCVAIGAVGSFLTVHFWIDSLWTSALVGMGYGIVSSLVGLMWWYKP